MFEKIISDRINKSIKIKENILHNADLVKKIDNISQEIIKIYKYKSNKKLILFGNGGSVADAQHLVAELVNKFYLDRKILSAIVLTVNTSILTVIGNDYSFNRIFSKQLEGIGVEEILP